MDRRGGLSNLNPPGLCLIPEKAAMHNDTREKASVSAGAIPARVLAAWHCNQEDCNAQTPAAMPLATEFMLSLGLLGKAVGNSMILKPRQGCG